MDKSVRSSRRGFTLVEVMIVVVTIAILAAVAIPSLSEHTKSAKHHTAKFNLHEVRALIELYRQQHAGKLPSATLAEMSVRTNSAGATGNGALYLFGPYWTEMPPNPITGSAVVRVAASNPPGGASGAVDAGWLYHAASGGIWIDDDELLEE